MKYVLAPDTRFERDHGIFFGSKGKVAKGELLINYGWNYGGLKEFVKAYYEATKSSTKNFETYYQKLKKYHGNLLKRMNFEKILPLPLRGLITARIHQRLFIPILVVDFKSIRFKYCEDCVRRWELRDLPLQIEQHLGTDKLSQDILGMRCTRMACNQLCGNYENCVLNYTSLEEDSETEEKILDCLASLIKLIRKGIEPSKAYECRDREATDNNPHRVGKLKTNQKCFERPVRFDFQPISRRHLDPDTWKEIQDQRIDHGPHHIIDLIPSSLLPDIYKKEIRMTDVSAPLEAMDVLQGFMKMANIRLEIKIDLSHYCNFCDGQHRLIRLPISAMFKTDQAYVQEAGFGRMLWQLLWTKFPEKMCQSYPKECQIANSPVLKRELSVSTLTKAEKNNRNYDYAINLKALIGKPGWLLFNLTTGLWKKGGFHETTLEPEKYIQYWKDMLVDIPSDLVNAKSLWYVVVPSTEEDFFDESAPSGVDDMNALISEISEGKDQQVFKYKVVFNSTPRKGEARHELRKLKTQQQFPQTSIYPVLQEMLGEVK